MKKKLLIILGVLIVLTPLGLLTDAPAWGEWDSDYFKQTLGFIPQGIEKFSHLISINAILPDYSLPGANLLTLPANCCIVFISEDEKNNIQNSSPGIFIHSLTTCSIANKT